MTRSPLIIATFMLLAPSFGQADLAPVTPPPILEQDVLAFPPVETPMGMDIGPVSRRDIDSLPNIDRIDNGEAASLEIIPLPQVHFPHNEATLSPEAVTLLSKTAKYIQDNQAAIMRVLINGHADEVASNHLNYTLGEERAYGVRQFLLAAGVDEQLLHTSSGGEVQPIDENWTPSGRARNRRVEVYILLSHRSL